MLRKLLLLVFICLPTLSYGVEITAKQAIMIDADTDAVLLSKDADVPMHPSSMSKLMTIYVAFQHLKKGDVKLDDKFKVSEKAWGKQGSKTFVNLGDEISVEALLHGIIIQSGNDACIVVAEGIAGTEEAFASEMNRVGKEIGLTGSHFVNATGWPDDNHLMTTRDLATLGKRLVLDFPEYHHYFSIPEYTYHGIRQYNRNPLLGGSLGVDGLKTGHTEIAGYGITLSAKKGSQRLVLVVNGLESEKARKEEGEKLLSYGFSEFTNKTLLTSGQKAGEAAVWFGTAEKVGMVAGKSILITLPKSKETDIKYILKYLSPVPTPIQKGDHIADLHILIAGGEPLVVPLQADADVAKASGLAKVKALFKYYTH